MNASSNIWLELLKAQEQGKAQARELHRLESSRKSSNSNSKSNSKNNKTTYIFDKSNYYVSLALELLNLSGSGVVEELLIKSVNTYTLVIKIDGREYHKTWHQYNELSQDVDGIVAVKRAGKYILHLSNIYFKDEINILLSGTGVYDIYVRVSYGN